MLNSLSPFVADTSGKNSASYLQIHSLINDFLSIEKLSDRLQDLPLQFENPQPRPWQLINWQSISCNQIIGIKPEIFLSILIGAIDTEAPIRDYTQTSRQYLAKIHPQMAQFVGGTVAENGNLIELGLWEKEERQHTPALIKVYSQLTGEKIIPKLRTVRGYIPCEDAYEDLYRHGLHRVATEYGATCLYLWLMAHATGSLQNVLEELVQDEINHMTKFWGFGIWLYPNTSINRVISTLMKTHQPNYQRNSLLRTLSRMMGILNWNSWTLTNKATLTFTFIYAMHRLWSWSNSLTPECLQDLFRTQQIIND